MPDAPTPPHFSGPERRRSRPAEVRLTDATIDYLEEKMKVAVAEGIKSAMTEDTAKAFWSAGLSVLQKQATAHTAEIALALIAELEQASGSPTRIVREGLILMMEAQAAAQDIPLALVRAKNKGYRLLKECEEQIAVLRQYLIT